MSTSIASLSILSSTPSVSVIIHGSRHDPVNDRHVGRIRVDRVAAGAALHIVIAGATVSARRYRHRRSSMSLPANRRRSCRCRLRRISVSTLVASSLSAVVRHWIEITRIRTAEDLVIAVAALDGVIPDVARQDVGVGRTGEMHSISGSITVMVRRIVILIRDGIRGSSTRRCRSCRPWRRRP